MLCQICADKFSQYRTRSRLFLCAECHAKTPEKATLDEFLKITGIPYETVGDRAMAVRLYDDYKLSFFGPVQKFWDSYSYH